MIIKPIKTHKIILGGSLFDVLNKYIKSVKEGSVIAITSKIVAICEGRVIKRDGTDKKRLIEKEADLILKNPKKSRYGIVITIKNNLLIPTAGIDESNGNGYYILWPENPQKTANKIRLHLKRKFRLKNLGVIITDSKTTPLRLGTSGVCIAYSGFSPLNNYIGQKDIFNRSLRVTKANIYDALASSAVLVMGEGNEQTPIAVIEDASFLKFKKGNPTLKEIRSLRIDLKDDLYSPLLKSVRWKKMKK